MTSIMLSPKAIFDQDFKHSMRGYDRKEVDEFLDDVIKDYETFMTQIKELQQENEELREQIKEASVSQSMSVTQSYQSSETVYGASSLNPSDLVKPSGAVTNFDILKRISRLEKEVFGKQITE